MVTGVFYAGCVGRLRKDADEGLVSLPFAGVVGHEVQRDGLHFYDAVFKRADVGLWASARVRCGCHSIGSERVFTGTPMSSASFSASAAVSGRSPVVTR